MSWITDNEGDEDGLLFNREARTFRFSERALSILENITKKMKTDSERETLKCALDLLSWVVDEREKGHRFCIEESEGIVREVVMSFMPPLGSDG